MHTMLKHKNKANNSQYQRTVLTRIMKH